MIMNNLLWIEKYRPNNFTQIVGQRKNIELLEEMIEQGSLPHLLLYGKPGTGKTSTIMAIADKLYGANKTFHVMKLDASDDRGINTVRDEIKGFAEKMTLFNQGIKLIILDEVDSMTFDAQAALRRIIEKYSDTTRFCLICNYENKIIPPIKVRCVNLRFYPIDKKIIIEKLKDICIKEELTYDHSSLDTIAELSTGDLRKSINILQSVSMRNKKITNALCYETAGVPSIKITEKIYKYLMNKDLDFDSIYEKINDNIIKKGISLSLFLKQLTKIIINNAQTIDNIKLANYLHKLAGLEAAVANSTFGYIYIISLIGIFKN